MKKLAFLSFCFLLSLTSCFDSKVTNSASAVATMESRSGSTVTGQVQFTEVSEGLKIDYKIQNLSNGKSYGFHIHENGDCSSADAKSAGKHYMPVAPTGGTSLDSPEKHAGDLPQIVASKEGRNEGSLIISDLSLRAKNPIIGKAIIIHDGPDNINENSPPRIACGVITAAP